MSTVFGEILMLILVVATTMVALYVGKHGAPRVGLAMLLSLPLVLLFTGGAWGLIKRFKSKNPKD